MKAFVVYDSAAGFYGPPFVDKSKGLAIRWFADQTKNPNSQISKSPADFTLFEIGDYDELTGEIIMTNKQSLGTALEYVQKA